MYIPYRELPLKLKIIQKIYLSTYLSGKRPLKYINQIDQQDQQSLENDFKRIIELEYSDNLNTAEEVEKNELHDKIGNAYHYNRKCLQKGIQEFKKTDQIKIYRGDGVERESVGNQIRYAIEFWTEIIKKEEETS
ncbi:13976_t:CDS:1 [Entrophospora sp. SA101]|nr:11692_t:CDS:1 [Entrophospora sp. SA101]CAJ0747665.1 13976_t:CDS:1 [Entrophospora sp. SA101]CAJ0836479.1 679_t:CDS:1 [Entrophospora sp. SA101]CAJ0923970.1 22106_t:CDS:1 [Entrophospora sp. SA101]